MLGLKRIAHDGTDASVHLQLLLVVSTLDSGLDTDVAAFIFSPFWSSLHPFLPLHICENGAGNRHRRMSGAAFR